MELTLDTHLQLLEWVPKRPQGLQGTLRELRAVRGLLPHSKTLKIPFHWEGRCSHEGYSLVIHRQGFLLPTTLLLPWQFAGTLLCFFFTQERELQGAQCLCSLLQPGVLDRPWAGRSRDTLPPKDGREPQFPGLTSSLQDLHVPLCWVMLLLSCLSSLWMHPPRAEQAGISLGAGRGRIPEC